MKELDMIKAFAELEGIKVELVDPDFDSMFYATIGENKRIEEYNPLLPSALNCAARDKYGVTVEYGFSSSCAIYEADKRGLLRLKSSSTFEHQPVSKAVIECILKSEGKWK